MRGNREAAVSSIRDEDLIEVFSHRLPDLLERRPDLEPTIFAAFLKTFARREEVALVLTELRSFRTEVERRFEHMDERFEHVDERIERSERKMQEFRAEVAGRFDEVQRAIDRLGSRWAPGTQASCVRGVHGGEPDTRHSGHGLHPQPQGSGVAAERDRGHRARGRRSGPVMTLQVDGLNTFSAPVSPPNTSVTSCASATATPSGACASASTGSIC